MMNCMMKSRQKQAEEIETIIESKGVGYIWTSETLRTEYNKDKAQTKHLSEKNMHHLLKLLKDHWIFKNNMGENSNLRYVFVRKK